MTPIYLIRGHDSLVLLTWLVNVMDLYEVRVSKTKGNTMSEQDNPQTVEGVQTEANAQQEENVHPAVGATASTLSSGLSAVQQLITLVERLPFVPSSIKTALTDLQAVLNFLTNL